MVSRYQKRISGPLLDRIDIHMDVPRVEYEKLSDERMGEPSSAIQARVEAARGLQQRRFGGTGLMSNADRRTCAGQVRAGKMREFCRVDDAGASLLRAAMKQLHGKRLSGLFLGRTQLPGSSHERPGLPPHPQAGGDDLRPGGE
jgi:magnesium chelatase family protein